MMMFQLTPLPNPSLPPARTSSPRYDKTRKFRGMVRNSNTEENLLNHLHLLVLHTRSVKPVRS